MKKVGEYTSRGQVPDGEHRIELFDGRFDTGYRVTRFVIAASNTAEDEVDFQSVKLATEPGLSADTWDWSDNREIAWSMFGYFANPSNAAFGGPSSFTEIDPENLIVEDLFLYVQSRNEDPVNYIIEFEKYDITDWQGALAMVRNRSQA